MLKLSPELTISQVEELHQQLSHELHVERDVSIDISEVTRADTASIQLLCALQKHLLNSHHKIIWHGQSTAFNNAVDELGLIAFLALDSIN
jgi:ABC-type transporter Mla MlaB component